MELESTEEGKRYRVAWGDCCAQGNFEAVLTRKNYVPDPPEPEPFLESLTFDNGVTISGHGVALEEAESASTEGRLRAIRQRAKEVLERSERSVRPFDPSLPPEGQGLPAGASRRCECRRLAAKIVEYHDDGIVMFWGVVCDEHSQADREVTISIA
jgi:hypothetical protein